MRKVVIIGYSGHAFVVCDILSSMGKNIIGYMEESPKTTNPFNIEYLGSEKELKLLENLKDNDFFIAVGDNQIRKRIYLLLDKNNYTIINVIHSNTVVSSSAKLENGIMIGPNVIINALSTIDHGTICNSGCIIEHECKISSFVHIGPGAVLCGNVRVGENSLIGAGSVIKPNIKIGSNVIVGAGTLVVKDIPDHSKVIGNPQQFL